MDTKINKLELTIDLSNVMSGCSSGELSPSHGIIFPGVSASSD